MTSRSQTVPLRFVVVGASVSGLCSAYLLRKNGHEVVVVEKAAHGVENGCNGSLRIPPNVTRSLATLPGVMDLLKEKGSWCSGVSFVSGETLELLGQMVFLEEVMSDLGSDFYFISYADLVSHLSKICRDVGVQIKYGFEVKEVLVDFNHPPTVVSEIGTRLSADIVVGADGKGSVVRRVVASEESDSEDEFEELRSSTEREQRYILAYALISLRSDIHEVTTSCRVSLDVPTSDLENDPELAYLTKDDRYVLWAGSGHTLSGACYGPDLYGVALVSVNASPQDLDTDWRESVPVTTLEKKLTELQKLVRKASSCRWSLQHTDYITRFTDSTHSVMVIGDAAHYLPPCATHNASCALEDAFTLGRLFSRITSRDQVPLLFSGYDQIRQKRTRQIEEQEYRGTAVVSLPPGPHRDGRDMALNMTLHLEGADDETLAEAWGGYLEAFSYDPVDAVDEWWLTWAKPMQFVEVPVNGLH
ncbi:hypothetical protein AAF712_004744 [Marasmius tenuissimus]|uniref:FAD-binding domain-containing protein n=1 Tax=Marasmius tenuissimus TaxID=585030 RepID=A0ABR3A438_9AGAR